MPQNTTTIPDALMGLEAEQVWDTERAFVHLKAFGEADTKRTAERRLGTYGLLPAELVENALQDEHGLAPNGVVLAWAIEQARKRRDRVFLVQISPLPSGKPCLHANDARGARFWVPLANVERKAVSTALIELQQHIDKPIAVFPHGTLVALMRDMAEMPNIRLCPQAYQPVLPVDVQFSEFGELANQLAPELPPHLKRLEAESIHIIREAVAEAQNPAMLYSIGKDSGVMLHLARKAFFPSPPPFPLLHVDTRWKFQEMYLFRDFMARESGMDLLVHTNPEAIEKNINPFDHGSSLHTDITKTEGLKQALDKYKFDLVFGGARRDEEKSRAKERIFSFRSATQRWDPKSQRPELWNLYNTRKSQDASIRVFPLSNWTELDIWHYIYLENIPMVPLYFAKLRPVVVRPEMIMLVDDERCKLLPGEEIQMRQVRFRTLGCYPLTGAVESEAQTPEDILLEIINTRQSERQGRRIDTDSAGSMEKKKQEGYF
ncbi:sulfate adenylyltransferase subunit CysD [Phytopseudomonas seleniipraecipitans]|uniref:Sulfate adenylyltransferase subunit 2 n=1 Tax=Phytopseudomonas seleniipraecipitans TaxID=640205 RepID=A0A1G7SFN2_9GAMM|nr:sulfate adenylyltransferase subunit CysD [Pseudomonas seleniipraecipitans]SDG21010.1 sulfate adenylyltransferase subunit 2 [Pseudomonas seleniipraecipitans]